MIRICGPSAARRIDVPPDAIASASTEYPVSFLSIAVLPIVMATAVSACEGVKKLSSHSSAAAAGAWMSVIVSRARGELVSAAEYGVAVRDYLYAAAGHGYDQRAKRQAEVSHMAAVHARSDVDLCIDDRFSVAEERAAAG